MNIPTIFKGILVATVIGSLIALALNYQPSVAAQSDTTPPVVTGVSVSPQVLNTSQSAQTTQVVYTVSRAVGKCTSGAEQNCTTERHSMSMKMSWSVEAWARSVS